MELELFEYYLIVANIVGFILFAINTWLYAKTTDGNVDSALTIISLLGGSLGILLAIFLIQRKVVKGNMMSRVFISCIFVIQFVLYLMVTGHIEDNLTFAFWIFFDKYKFLLVYLALINIVTLVTFGLDKLSAIQNKYRTRNITLLILAFIGGSLGGMLAMYLFRHKINKDYFVVGLPLIILMQVIVLFFFMNISF